MRVWIFVLDKRALAAWGCLVGLLALSGWWCSHLVRPALAPTEAVAGKTVVIDPGHGGPDPGAVGVAGSLEKEIVLAISDRLEPMLNRAAVYTLRLRDGDYDMVERQGRSGSGSRKRDDLLLRAKAANDAGADLFISLHANSFPSPRWKGAQTFYAPGRPESKLLAEALQHRLREAFSDNTRKARPGDYLVLKETRMPAVVVEVGFLSNPDEERLLTTASHQQKVAEAIYQGILDYLIGQFRGESPGEGGVTETSAEGLLPGEEVVLPPDGFRLYFAAGDDARDGLRAVAAAFPDEMAGESISRRIAYALDRLASGPPKDRDLFPVMPPGAKVLAVELENDRVKIDLSREVRTRAWGGGRSEGLLVESIARTVGQFPGVRWFSLSVEGDVAETLSGHVDISQPLEAISLF